MQFDRYSRGYGSRVNEALAFSGTEQEVYLRAKADHIVRLATEHLGAIPDPALLDVGCGVGLVHGLVRERFPNVTGVDVARTALAHAARDAAGGRFALFDGRHLPFDADAFDLTYAVNVLHHVAPEEWGSFTAELARVTRPGGLVLVFEHNPRNPLTRLVVSRCEFDEDAVLVGHRRLRALLREAGLTECDHRYIVFFPWPGRPWTTFERALGWLPAGAQHLVAALKPAVPAP